MIKTLAVATIVFLLSAPAFAEDASTILSTCSENHSHVEMSECVKNVVAKSELDLKSAESAVNVRLAGDDDPEPLATAKKGFEASKNTFKVYRDKQCNFAAAMAMGGNSAHDLRAACIASINDERTGQLKWLSGIGK